MKHIFLCLMILGCLVLNAFAVTRTVSWDPVTTYTDNTSIEPEKLPVTYIVKMDNVVICTTTDTSCTIEHINAGQDHLFTAMARLVTLEESAWSPDCPWPCPPAGTPSTTPDKPIIITPIRRP